MLIRDLAAGVSQGGERSFHFGVTGDESDGW